jgi:hypothetical protein
MILMFPNPGWRLCGMRRFGFPWALEWNTFRVGNTEVILESPDTVSQSKSRMMKRGRKGPHTVWILDNGPISSAINWRFASLQIIGSRAYFNTRTYAIE